MQERMCKPHGNKCFGQGHMGNGKWEIRGRNRLASERSEIAIPV